MKRKIITEKTSLNINNSMEGETIETKIARIMDRNEPIGEESPIIYQARKEGVKPEYDIRADKWDIANDAMTAVNKSKITQRATLYAKKSEGSEPVGDTSSEDKIIN